MLSTRTAEVSADVVRTGLAGAFRLRAAPVPPGLFDLAMSVPTMSTARARTELGWEPLHDAGEALQAFLDGLEDKVAAATPPLARTTSGPGRARSSRPGSGGAVTARRRRGGGPRRRYTRTPAPSPVPRSTRSPQARAVINATANTMVRISAHSAPRD